MGKKTITMSYDDYQMMSVDNETHKALYDQLKQEKMVYLTVADDRTRYSHISQLSGQVVEKDELLKKMQEHLESAKRKMQERKDYYERRIEELEERLRQASVNPVETTITRWWHKLLK